MHNNGQTQFPTPFSIGSKVLASCLSIATDFHYELLKILLIIYPQRNHVGTRWNWKTIWYIICTSMYTQSSAC